MLTFLDEAVKKIWSWSATWLMLGCDWRYTRTVTAWAPDSIVTLFTEYWSSLKWIFFCNTAGIQTTICAPASGRSTKSGLKETSWTFIFLPRLMLHSDKVYIRSHNIRKVQHWIKQERNLISPLLIKDMSVLFWLSLWDAAVTSVTSHDAERTLTDWMTLGELICIIPSGHFTAEAAWHSVS